MRTTLIAIGLTLIAAAHAEPAPAPAPAPPPFDLPTLDGSGARSRLSDGDLPALVDGIDPDLEALHARVVACYPSRSLFRVELSAVAGARTDSGISADDNGAVSDLGRVYIGLVARMPLYSDSEIDRERERELRWRQDAADRLAKWAKALYDSNTAVRALSLYTALERRARARVAQGISDATEQVGYLEKVIAQREATSAARAAVDSARLGLTALCQDDRRAALDGELRRAADAATHAAAPAPARERGRR